MTLNTSKNASPSPNHDPNPNPNAYNYNVLLGRLAFAFIAVAIFTGTAILVVYLVVHPKTPSFSLTTLAISSFNISTNKLSYDSSIYTLTCAIDLTLAIKNPNLVISNSYDPDYAYISRNGSDLASVPSIPPFYQKAGKPATVSLRMVTGAMDITADLASTILMRMARGDRVGDIYLRFWSTVTYRYALQKWKAYMRVDCDGVEVAFSNATTGAMANGPRLCDVEAYLQHK